MPGCRREAHKDSHCSEHTGVVCCVLQQTRREILLAAKGLAMPPCRCHNQCLACPFLFLTRRGFQNEHQQSECFGWNFSLSLYVTRSRLEFCNRLVAYGGGQER